MVFEVQQEAGGRRYELQAAWLLSIPGREITAAHQTSG